METPLFLELLHAASLSSYLIQLQNNGFDDVDALCNITKGDLIKLDIPTDQWETTEGIFLKVRCKRATNA